MDTPSILNNLGVLSSYRDITKYERHWEKNIICYDPVNNILHVCAKCFVLEYCIWQVYNGLLLFNQSIKIFTNFNCINEPNSCLKIVCINLKYIE